jgi:2-oxoglutarate/2-oxoacid ferredoxin oxidoreductase subunit alpha
VRREGRAISTRLLQGSEAIAEAAIAVGCRFFTGYPFTPFTELLENMAKKLPAAGGVCVNAASELEAVNMTLGAAATGARAATGSCGQGLSLMQEGIAEMALNELPVVLFNMARGQQDYFQATRGGGWGDYRTIALAPKNVYEAVEHTQLLFHLADLYRTPVLLYGDYVIAHSSVGIEITVREFPPTPAKDWALDGSASGSGRAKQIWTWAMGKPNTPGPGASASWERIAAKYDEIARTEARHEARFTDDADILLVSFGTTSVFVDRLVDELRAEGVRIGSFRPITLWPFSGEALEEATRGVRHVLVYELNAGQMVEDVRMYAADRSVVRSIGGVSQDISGMRQGALFSNEELRRRVMDAVGLNAGAS